MPGKDGTGPLGTWSNCDGRPAAGFGAARFGRGAGMKRGSGLGRRITYGNSVGNSDYSANSDKTALEKQASFLEKELAAVKSRLSTLASTDKKTDSQQED